MKSKSRFYCCEEFDHAVKIRAITGWSNIYPTHLLKVRGNCFTCGNTHSQDFEIAYCPFCGKKLKLQYLDKEL